MIKGDLLWVGLRKINEGLNVGTDLGVFLWITWDDDSRILDIVSDRCRFKDLRDCSVQIVKEMECRFFALRIV